jgi:fructose-1,6-bisphosphatase II / sedoheptulose-1,7-bisphosphatase
MVSGDVVVCATGVTDGPLVSGVVFGRGYVETETVAYRSTTRTIRRIRARRPAAI